MISKALRALDSGATPAVSPHSGAASSGGAQSSYSGGNQAASSYTPPAQTAAPAMGTSTQPPKNREATRGLQSLSAMAPATTSQDAALALSQGQAPPQNTTPATGVTPSEQPAVMPSTTNDREQAWNWITGGSPFSGVRGNILNTAPQASPPRTESAGTTPAPTTPTPTTPAANQAGIEGIMPWDMGTYELIKGIYAAQNVPYTPAEFIQQFYVPRFFANPSYNLPQQQAA